MCPLRYDQHPSPCIRCCSHPCLHPLQSERKYDPFTSYALSKLANTITAVELQRRLDRAAMAAGGSLWAYETMH